MARDTRRDPIRNVREPAHPKYTKRDVAVGTKHELEHTKDRRIAKQIALAHLKEFYNYYRVLPAAEATMTALQDKPPGKPRKRRRPVKQQPNVPPGWNSTPW